MFKRGNTHLSQLQGIEHDITAMGVTAKPTAGYLADEFLLRSCDVYLSRTANGPMDSAALIFLPTFFIYPQMIEYLVASGSIYLWLGLIHERGDDLLSRVVGDPFNHLVYLRIQGSVGISL